MRLGILLLLLVACGDARSCTPADLWDLCQKASLCNFLYRNDGLAGVKRAYDYYQNHAWILPLLPMQWQPFSPLGPDCGNASTTTISTAESLPSSLVAAVLALQSFPHYAEGTAGCPAPQVSQCDDETGQCECFCPSATGALSAVSDGDTFCVATDSCQNSLTNWAIGLGIAGLVIILLGLILVFVVTLRAFNS